MTVFQTISKPAETHSVRFFLVVASWAPVGPPYIDTPAPAEALYSLDLGKAKRDMAESSHFVDLTHHLSPETLIRKANPLKDLIRVALENPHLVSLANGNPHSSLCPFRRVDFEVASITAGDDPVFAWRAQGPSAPTQTLTAGGPEDADSAQLLRASMAYGHGAGLDQILRVVEDLNKFYHTAPAHVATMTLGNADAITKVFRLLGAQGDYFLADEFTFGPMPLAAEAHGIKWVPVRIDPGGIIPEELERVLSEWDPERGRRPHVLYTTPCGQNPTGSTLSLERRKSLYGLAQKFDFIIIEDDPYYFLQYDPPNAPPSDPAKPFPTSFLSLDVDGRVIRIDSFSKVLAPGLRLGYITTAPLFRPHLINLIDFSTQNPSGLPQVLLTQLLGPTGWQLAGFDRWVRSLRHDYQRRRDHFLALFERHVASTGWARADMPEAGMFFWVRVSVERHPRFHTRATDTDVEPALSGGGGGRPRAVARTNAKALMEELFEACVAAGLLVCPATIFVLPTGCTFERESIHDRSNFLRLTFAGSEEAMTTGIPILGKVLQEFFANPGKPDQ
ncbi:L-tyrosine:2-oxoglutarate aminotransferase [Ganoderma leucocontextum]|nr:L-tyrosine:2-oxoglutarate aminotransferase [Ganoderma leucocontextum]